MYIYIQHCHCFSWKRWRALAPGHADNQRRYKLCVGAYEALCVRSLVMPLNECLFFAIFSFYAAFGIIFSGSQTVRLDSVEAAATAATAATPVTTHIELLVAPQRPYGGFISIHQM